MSALLDDAIEALSRMPEDMQEAAARAILELGTGPDSDIIC